ncbi:MAG: hypothetical protein HWD59_01500 [Coxiellaceae bacterium]|nr:MAG: hypothetical protein HWD59_01500 [Coxiellaceae bacterium]
MDDPNAKFIFTKEDLKDFRVGYGKAFRTTHVEASEETDYYNNRTAVVNGRFLCPDSIPTMMDWYCNWMTDRFDDCKKLR